MTKTTESAILKAQKEFGASLSIPQLCYEVSEMTPAQLRSLKETMLEAGWKFDRTELRYATCVTAVFERVG